MAIAKVWRNGIIAYRFQFRNRDILFAGLQNFLSGAVSNSFGRGCEYPQVFVGQIESPPVIETDLKYFGNLMQLDFGRIGTD